MKQIAIMKSMKKHIPGVFFSFVNPLPDDKILDWSKLKQIADDILKCI